MPDLPADATVAELYHWLAEPKRAKHLTDEQIALRSAVVFVVAVGEGAADRAVALVDVVGYQPLPIAGPLPESPDRAVQKDSLKALIGRAARFPAAQFPARRFEVLPRKPAQAEFPSVSQWMLPDDVVIVVRAADAVREDRPAATPGAADGGGEAVPPHTGGAGPLSRDAVIVVRLRARKPTIVAGTLFDCLPAAAGP